MKIIDINTLEPQKDSFINKELEEGFSDMLFRVNINNREGYIYLLFEHKSYASKDVAFQLLKYMIEIWNTKMKKQKIYELPIIIPLVIYHGKDKWNGSTTLGEMLDGYKNLPEDVQKYIPNYEYLLYDISGYTEEEIKGEAINKIENTYPEGSEVVMTLAEKLRKEGEKQGILKGIEKGIEKGVELGARQSKVEVARKLIKMNMSLEQIADITGLPNKKVEEIAEELWNRKYIGK